MYLPFLEYSPPFPAIEALFAELKDPTNALVERFLRAEPFFFSDIKPRYAHFRHNASAIYLVFNHKDTSDGPVYAGSICFGGRSGAHAHTCKTQNVDRISKRFRGYKKVLSRHTYPDEPGSILLPDTYGKVIIVSADFQLAKTYEDCLIKHFNPPWNDTGFGCDKSPNLSPIEKSSWGRKYPRYKPELCQEPSQNIPFLLQ